jgi:prophage regulatory protein
MEAFMVMTPPIRMLRLPEVLQMTGIGRDSVYRLAKAGKFPQPYKLTDRASAWREDEVVAWIDSRPPLRRVEP